VKGPESEGDAVEGEGFGQRRRCKDCGEWAEGSQPERIQAGALVPDAAGEVGEQEA